MIILPQVTRLYNFICTSASKNNKTRIPSMTVAKIFNVSDKCSFKRKCKVTEPHLKLYSCRGHKADFDLSGKKKKNKTLNIPV